MATWLTVALDGLVFGLDGRGWAWWLEIYIYNWIFCTYHWVVYTFLQFVYEFSHVVIDFFLFVSAFNKLVEFLFSEAYAVYIFIKAPYCFSFSVLLIVVPFSCCDFWFALIFL